MSVLLKGTVFTLLLHSGLDWILVVSLGVTTWAQQVVLFGEENAGQELFWKTYVTGERLWEFITPLTVCLLCSLNAILVIFQLPIPVATCSLQLPTSNCLELYKAKYPLLWFYKLILVLVFYHCNRKLATLPTIFHKASHTWTLERWTRAKI